MGFEKGWTIRLRLSQAPQQTHVEPWVFAKRGAESQMISIVFLNKLYGCDWKSLRASKFAATKNSSTIKCLLKKKLH